MRVVVIGAGIIGSSVAYEAAKAGAQVTVLEAGRIAGGASTTSFAWTNATGKRPQSYYALNVAGMRAHLDLAREFGHAPWFHQTGSIEWYQNEADWPAQRDNANEVRDWGYGVEWISKTRVADLEPEINLSAIGNSPIVYYPEEGWIQPALYAAWLLRAAKEKWNTDIRPYQGVKSIDVRNGVAKAVKSIDGTVYEANAIINCTGSWAADVLEGVPAIPMASTRRPIQSFCYPRAASVCRLVPFQQIVCPCARGGCKPRRYPSDSLHGKDRDVRRHRACRLEGHSCIRGR